MLGPVVIRADGEDQTAAAALDFAGFSASWDDSGDLSVLTLTPNEATSGAAGSMSAEDKEKLDGMQAQGTAQAVSALEIDWSSGGVFTKTLSAGSNTFTFANASSGKMIVVRLTGAASTVTWPTVLWAGGTPPTQTASGKDVYTFVHDGSDIYGSVVQDFS